MKNEIDESRIPSKEIRFVYDECIADINTEAREINDQRAKAKKEEERLGNSIASMGEAIRLIGDARYTDENKKVEALIGYGCAMAVVQRKIDRLKQSISKPTEKGFDRIATKLFGEVIRISDYDWYGVTAKLKSNPEHKKILKSEGWL